LFLGQRSGLLRIPELIKRLLETFRRIQIELKQKLHGAFPRLPAFTHANKMAKNPRASKEKSHQHPRPPQAKANKPTGWSARTEACVHYSAFFFFGFCSELPSFLAFSSAPGFGPTRMLVATSLPSFSMACPPITSPTTASSNVAGLPALVIFVS